MAATACTIGTVATIGAYGVAAGLAATGASDGVEAITGTNLIRDKLMGGNDEAYSYLKDGLNIASAGIVVAGSVGSSMGLDSPNCFVKGTIIKTSLGDKPIEDIKVGDLVYAENLDTREKGLKQVVRLFRNKTY